MNTSVISFPDRGPWGKANWRGNTSGHVIKAMLEHFRPRVFVDPAQGSGTSCDVARELQEDGWQIEYIGLDLHSGFNLLRDSLAKRIGGQRADYVFFHPPYWNMVRYSGEQWGREAHPDDLSHSPTYEDFLTKMHVAITNIYDAIKSDGHYSLLVGDIRRNGNYISLQADLLQIAPGKLSGIVIKRQHNVESSRKNYAGAFIPIEHEYLINIRKDSVVFGLIDTSLATSEKLAMLSRANWKGTITSAMNKLGGTATVQELYKAIEETAGDKTATRPNWQARVRAELQKHFVRVDHGLWALPEAA